MSRLDDRLTTELERAAQPADPAGVFERIDGRRVRRHRARRTRAGALAVVVIAGSIGGFAYLNRAFGPTRVPGGGGETSVHDGLIVVSVFDQFGLAHLWTVDPSSRQRRPLTAGSPTDPTTMSDGSPAVSPDGLTVAFARSDSRDHASAIYTIGIDGRNLTKITDAGADPAWSPDGSRLAFSRDLLGSSGIWAMDADGSDPTLIAGTDTLNTGDPAWSPDGTTLAFEGFRQEDGGKTWDLFTIPFDATGPLDLRQLTDTPDLSETSASWSPDGTRIVFSRMALHPNASQNVGITTMVLNTGDVVSLTIGGARDQNPTWSPSGSSIAFDRSINGQAAVYTIGTDGSDLTEVGEGVDPAWLPIRSEPSISPSLQPSPTPSEGEGVDLGLGFPVCNVQPLGGDAEGGGDPDFDGDGRVDTAYLATKKSDVGGCPQADTASNILGIDLTGDGMIDVEYGPIGCELDCRPFMAIDLDDDGDDELLVQQLGGAILGLVPYAIVSVDGSTALGALTVIPPGDADHGFAPDEPVTFYLGGDEGFSAMLDCRGTGVERVLVSTTGQLDSIEQPNKWTIHRTTFRLGSQGFDVVDTETFDQLVKDVSTPGSQQETNLCGIPFPPNPVFETP